MGLVEGKRYVAILFGYFSLSLGRLLNLALAGRERQATPAVS